MTNISKNNEDLFQSRHIGPREEDLPAMLDSIGLDSLDQLIGETIPQKIRLNGSLNLPDAISEQKYRLTNFTNAWASPGPS